MVSRSFELFRELWNRAVPRHHPVMCCVTALEHNPAFMLTRTEPALWRLAEELVDSAEEFLAAVAPYSTVHGKLMVCSICGSALCPHYQRQHVDVLPVALIDV